MGLGIGIAGAGIGGLAAASLLADRGHRVAVFDRFDAPRPVGSGLIVQPVGLGVLGRIGAAGAALALGAPIARLHGLEIRAGRTVLDVSYGAEAGLALHRAALFSVLHDAAMQRGIALRGGQAVVGRDGQRFRFEGGGTSEPFDLLVDASGTGSLLSPLRGRPLSYGALWGVVDWVEGTGLHPRHLSQRYREASRRIGILPIGRLPGDPASRAAVFWSLPRDGHDAWRARGLGPWKAEAAALWPKAMPFLDQIDRPSRMTMARYEHGSLRRPFAEGLAFLGDAAHRTSPQLGQGANMALLDALALACALDLLPGRAQLPEALRAFAAARRWHLRAYQLLSAAFTPQYQSDSRLLPPVRDRVLAPLSRVPPLPRILSALVAGRLLPPLASLLPEMGAAASPARHAPEESPAPGEFFSSPRGFRAALVAIGCRTKHPEGQP